MKACKGTLACSIVLGVAHGLLATRSPCPRNTCASFPVAATRSHNCRCMSDASRCRRVRGTHMVLVCGCAMTSMIAAIPTTAAPTTLPTAMPTYAPDGAHLHGRSVGCSRPAMGCAIRGFSRCTPLLCKPHIPPTPVASVGCCARLCVLMTAVARADLAASAQIGTPVRLLPTRSRL